MHRGLFVEPLPGESEAARTATPGELAEAAAFGTAARRREYLAWRAIVRRELGPVEIGYDAAGAPVILNRAAIHLGVSHCPGWVAVRISEHPCAVDIEPKTRNFTRAIPRYMTPAEQALCDHPLLPGMVWCAKECLYKYARQPGLDLLRDIRIEAVDPAAGRIAGRIENGAPVGLSVLCDERLLIVHID